MRNHRWASTKCPCRKDVGLPSVPDILILHQILAEYLQYSVSLLAESGMAGGILPWRPVAIAGAIYLMELRPPQSQLGFWVRMYLQKVYLCLGKIPPATGNSANNEEEYRGYFVDIWRSISRILTVYRQSFADTPPLHLTAADTGGVWGCLAE